MEFSDKHSHILERGYIVKADETEDNNAFQGPIVGFDSVYVFVQDPKGNIYNMFDYELELVEIPFK